LNDFPKMIYRDGMTLLDHGVDYMIVSGEAELANALADGWREELVAFQAPARHPLDLDGDGAPGGSLPEEERGLEALQAEAEALGIAVDRRWGEKRLRAEIAKVAEAEGA
jgi:hypothetical protein